MNYFPFYRDPVDSVCALDDKRVRRSFWLATCTLNEMAAAAKAGLKQITPKRALWLHDTPDTLAWYIEWTRALAEECLWRSDGKQYTAHYLWERLPDEYKNATLSDQPQLTNKAVTCTVAKQRGDFTHLEVHEAYRQYLVFRWNNLDRRAPIWTKRQRPTFYQGATQ